MEAVGKLKGTVEILLFDTSNSEKHFLLVCDGRRWQISELIYNIAQYINGSRSIEDITNLLVKNNNEQITAKETEIIINQFFVKRGLLENTEDTIEARKSHQSKYLWGKVPLIKGSFIQKFKFLSVLFKRKVIYYLLSISFLIQLFAYLKYININDFFYLINFNSPNILITFILLYIAIFFHEFGHMAAFMKYDISPGNIGFAMYFTAPALYSDVSNAWKLKRKQRVLVDVGGMYFECIFFTAICLIGLVLSDKIYVFTGFIGQISIYRNMNPFLKFDGYWVVSDFLGIPNLHDRVIDFFMSIVYTLLGVNKTAFKLNINKKEKRMFYIFAVFNVFYVVTFIVGIVTLFIITFGKVKSMLFNLLTGKVLIYSFSSLFIFIKGNATTLILFLILIRLSAISIKALIKSLKKIIENVRNSGSKLAG